MHGADGCKVQLSHPIAAQHMKPLPFGGISDVLFHHLMLAGMPGA